MDNKPDCAMCGEPYNRHNGLFCPVYATYRPKPPEAADEITRLNAENERLREALKPFARVAKRAMEADPALRKGDAIVDVGRFTIYFSDFRRALITKASRDSGHG